MRMRMETNGRYKNFFQQTDPRDIDMAAVVSALERILERMDLTDKHNEERDTMIKNIISAFPSGDFDAHRKYHELQMELLAEKRKLRVAIQEKTISGLIWLTIIGIGTAVWHEFLTLVKK